jgi:hypothetical protein
MMVDQLGDETHIIHILSVSAISVQFSSVIPVSLHAVRVDNHEPFLICQRIEPSTGQTLLHIPSRSSSPMKDNDQREMRMRSLHRRGMKAISSRSPFIGHGSGAVSMVMRSAFALVDGTAACMCLDRETERKKEKQDRIFL